MSWISVRDKIRSGVAGLLPQSVTEPYRMRKMAQKYQRSLLRNQALVPDGKIPDIYNRYGEAMDLFYLEDDHYRHQPYSLNARYFLWDRFNWGLDVHFYTGFHMFRPRRKAGRMYGWLMESETIARPEYEAVYRQPEALTGLDKVFTFSEKTLNTLPNAAFVPAGYVRYGHPWYDTATMRDDTCQRKTGNISIISSDKEMCRLHKVRRDTALCCKATPALGVDVFGTVRGGSYACPDDYLTGYRFSLVFENDVQKYFFTEKILNCFAAMTIPVYLGAPAIGDFFNPDGIIPLSEDDCADPRRLEAVLAQCTEEEYLARQEAVLDNYRRVQDYMALENYLYKNYFAADDYFINRLARNDTGPVTRIC